MPANGTEKQIGGIGITPGTWVITANVYCWMTTGTVIYVRLSDNGAIERRYASAAENNIVLTTIVHTDVATTVPVVAAHADVNGSRTFIAKTIKAVKIA